MREKNTVALYNGKHLPQEIIEGPNCSSLSKDTIQSTLKTLWGIILYSQGNWVDDLIGLCPCSNFSDSCVTYLIVIIYCRYIKECFYSVKKKKSLNSNHH